MAAIVSGRWGLAWIVDIGRRAALRFARLAGEGTLAAGQQIPIDAAKLRELALAYEAWVATEGAAGALEGLSMLSVSGADLSGLDLSGIVGIDAHLPAVSFRGSHLSGATLLRLYAPDACFERANLVKADLSGACLRGVSLSRAKLFRADLTGADLRGADLRGADLRGTNLDRTDLRGACVDGVQIDAYTSFVDARWDPGP